MGGGGWNWIHAFGLSFLACCVASAKTASLGRSDWRPRPPTWTNRAVFTFSRLGSVGLRRKNVAFLVFCLIASKIAHFAVERMKDLSVFELFHVLFHTKKTSLADDADRMTIQSKDSFRIIFSRPRNRSVKTNPSPVLKAESSSQQHSSRSDTSLLFRCVGAQIRFLLPHSISAGVSR
jgi:hypothetical protein